MQLGSNIQARGLPAVLSSLLSSLRTVHHSCHTLSRALRCWKSMEVPWVAQTPPGEHTRQYSLDTHMTHAPHVLHSMSGCHHRSPGRVYQDGRTPPVPQLVAALMVPCDLAGEAMKAIIT